MVFFITIFYFLFSKCYHNATFFLTLPSFTPLRHIPDIGSLPEMEDRARDRGIALENQS